MSKASEIIKIFEAKGHKVTLSSDAVGPHPLPHNK